MKNILKIISVLLLLSCNVPVNSDVGYVSQTIYNNTWRTNVNIGQNVVDLVLPYPIWLDVIIVGGEQTGLALLKVGNYEVRRYLYSANMTTGEVLQNPIYVKAGDHIKIILENGTAGYHTASISGRLVVQ